MSNAAPFSTAVNGRTLDAAPLKNALNAVADGVTDIRGEVASLAGAIGEEVKARAGKAYEASKASTLETLEKTRTQVRRHPAATIGAAAGAGILLGLLIGARR